MNKIQLHKIFLTLAVLCLTAGLASAQTVKTIAVSNDKSYTDHISLGQDSRDMDVMIKFIFDESKNTLTVSLISYRRLFVFREAARYSSVVRCSRLHPDKLPYVVDSEAGTHYKLSKQFKKSIPAPRCKYIFSRWIEYDDGLQPTPLAYKMVNDYIEQSFDILDKRNAVSVTLRDLFLMDPMKKKATSYLLSAGRDLNLKYQIAIVRNPCFGLEQDIQVTQASLNEVRKAYQGLKSTFSGGTVTTQESLKTFQDTRAGLLAQYVVKDADVPCPDLRDALQQYNAYVDSIGKVKCVLVSPEESAWDDGKPLDTKLIYTQARQLDKAVARWLVSKDELERQDLVSQGEDIIKDVSAMIRQHRITTAEEQKAVQAYNQAEQYFKKTCKK